MTDQDAGEGVNNNITLNVNGFKNEEDNVNSNFENESEDHNLNNNFNACNELENENQIINEKENLVLNTNLSSPTKNSLFIENTNEIHLSKEKQTPKFEIEANLQFSLYCNTINKIEEQIMNSNSIIENYFKENSELKQLNDILEREINLLKSLILINNLNLNTSDTKPCKYP
jgi:hypothetical protein